MTIVYGILFVATMLGTFMYVTHDPCEDNKNGYGCSDITDSVYKGESK